MPGRAHLGSGWLALAALPTSPTALAIILVRRKPSARNWTATSTCVRPGQQRRSTPEIIIIAISDPSQLVTHRRRRHTSICRVWVSGRVEIKRARRGPCRTRGKRCALCAEQRRQSGSCAEPGVFDSLADMPEPRVPGVDSATLSLCVVCLCGLPAAPPLAPPRCGDTERRDVSLLDMRWTTAPHRPRHLCSGAALRFHNTVILPEAWRAQGKRQGIYLRGPRLEHLRPS